MRIKNNKKKNLIELFLLLIGLIVINIVFSFVFARFDLTTEKRFTLSENSTQLLSNLNDEIYIKVYLDGADLPVGFKRMRKAIKELLDEFKIHGGQNINYQFINPTESPDKEIRFGQYKELYEKGLMPIESEEEGTEGKTSQKMLFPGAILVYQGVELGVNLLKNDPRYENDGEQNINNSIQSLEYEFTNGIRKLNRSNRQQIAFLEGQGELSEYQVMNITNTLSEYYDVRRGAILGQKGILDPFAAVIVAKPTKKFEEKDKFILDQYLMNGGKILWLVDGIIVDMDSLTHSPVTVAMPNILNIEDQLFTYGVRINNNLIQDIQCAPIGVSKKGSDGKPQIKLQPWRYFPLLLSHNNHPINKYLEQIRTEFVSTLDTVNLSAKVQKTALLHSSDYTKVENGIVEVRFDEVNKQPVKSEYQNGSQMLGVLLEGVFKSNYASRLNVNKFGDVSDMKKESKNTKMIVIADGDFIANQISSKGDVYPIGFDRYSQQTYAGNREFILNAINYLCDDSGLMDVRSRELKLRLLDKNKIKAQRVWWQSLNVLAPIVIVLLFGLIYIWIKKRKYTR